MLTSCTRPNASLLPFYTSLILIVLRFCCAEIRHDCNQGDQLDSYGWTSHDLRQGGVQVIKDGNNNLELKIEWIKVPGGAHGGSWAARISGKPLKIGSRLDGFHKLRSR